MNKKSKQPFLIWILVIAIGIVCTFFVEMYQLVIPGRAFNIVDCYFNILGLVTGIVLPGFVYHKKMALN